MFSVPGFGTGFRGWRHGAQGFSTATQWVTVAYLPLVPVQRCVVRRPAGDGRGVEVMSGTPLAWREIASTWMWSWVGLPVLCLWPVLVARWILGDVLPERGIELPQAAHVGIAIFVLANLAGVLGLAGLRASGERLTLR